MSHVRGEDTFGAKLTEDQVRVIRRNVNRARELTKKIAEKHSVKRYAEEYGVSEATICRVARGRNWAHVK